MPNAFDQFDTADATVNAFDQFDEGNAADAPAALPSPLEVIGRNIPRSSEELAAQNFYSLPPELRYSGKGGYQDPIDVGGYKITQGEGEFFPSVKAPEKAGAIPKITAGAYNMAKSIPNFVLSPEGIATAMLPEFAGAKWASRILKPLFTASMTKAAAQSAGEASVTGDPQTITEAGLAGLGAGLVGAADLESKPSTERTPNASSLEKTAALHGDVRPLGEPAAELPAAESGGGVQPSPAQEPAGDSAPQQRASGDQISLTPAVSDFSEKFTGGTRLSTQDAVSTGMASKTVADLDHLADLRTESAAQQTEMLKRASAETDPAKRDAIIQKVLAKNVQMPREAIEAATNTGSHIEGEGQGALQTKYGERPLDWKTHPEVADWLRKNAGKLGIELPDDFPKEVAKGVGAELVGLEKQAESGKLSEGETARLKKLRDQSAASQGDKAAITAVMRNQSLSMGEKMAKIAELQKAAVAAKAEPLKMAESKIGDYQQVVKLASGEIVHGDTHNDIRDSLSPEQARDSKRGWLAPDGTFLRSLPEVVRHREAATAAGPGGTIPSDVGAKPELAQLTDAVRTMAEGQPKPQLRRAYTMGERLSQAKDAAGKAIDGLRAAALYGKTRLAGMPVWNGLKEAVGNRQVSLGESSQAAKEFTDKALRAVPDAIDREAISNWVDAGGDEAVIRKGLAETKDVYKKGYERALKLTPEQITLAKNIQNYFSSRLDDAISTGILEHGIEDYIHRTYAKDSPWKKGVLAELRSGVFTGKPALAKQRVFQYDFEAEKAGYKPIKDFVQRIAEYDQSLNKSIADRRMVKEMMSQKMPDGRPAIDTAGIGSPVEGAPDANDALLVKSQARPKDTDPKSNRADYKPYDHPALRKWKWVDTDANGKTTMLQGEVLIHPDAMKQIKAVFGKSWLREGWFWNAALKGSSVVKQTMLDLSGFHPVQITVHGWEHRTFKPVEKIDFQDPTQRALVSHGLVAGDMRGQEMFSEGLTGSSLTKHIPGIGPKLQAYNHWLFQDYIPRLKMAMGLHALERNRSRFPKMGEDELLHLTANQANAAFGELNYEMMGRNKTVQDVMRLGLLAPDFLEARGKFAAQAATKYGAEQRQALLLGAATLYLTARIINKQLDDQYHFEPANAFNVIYQGKAYSLRTVQGDILHAAMQPSQFIRNRLNPSTTRPLMEFTTGRDYFGRKRTGLEQIKDMGSQLVPISFRGVLNPREQSLMESFMNAFGITERRVTATDTAGQLALKFKQAHKIQEPGEFIYDPDKDPYRGVKLALLYEDPRKAAQEIKHAIDNGDLTVDKITKYFNRYAAKPLTGSAAHEKAFVASLSDDQKKTYQESVNERKKMATNAKQALRIYQFNFTARTPAAPQTPDWAK